MSKILETTNPYTGMKRKMLLEGDVTIGGGKEKKYLREIIFTNSKKRRAISIIERGPYQYWPYATERVLRIWKACKAAGVPVVPMLRLTSDDTLISTNMKADGSEVYGKAMSMYFLKSRESDLTENDELFIFLYPKVREKIKRLAYEIADITSKNGILLPIDDAFEILLHTDGSWELIVLDLLQGDVDKIQPKGERIRQLYDLNRSAVDITLQILETLYFQFVEIRTQQSEE